MYLADTWSRGGLLIEDMNNTSEHHSHGVTALILLTMKVVFHTPMRFFKIDQFWGGKNDHRFC